MNSKSLFLTVAIVAILFSNAFSQFEYISIEKSKALANRTILVELYDEVSEAEIQTNKNIKEYFQQNLKIGKEVICVTAKEINVLLKSQKDKEKYALITHNFDNYEIKSVTRTKRVDNNMLVSGLYKGLTYKEKHTIATLQHFDLTLSIVSGNKKLDGVVTEIGFIHLKLRPEDYVFAASQFNRLYDASISGIKSKDYYDPKLAIESLKSKTLLIDKDNIEFEAKKIEGYDYNYEFVDYSVITEAIFSKTPQKVYALLIWSNQLNAYDWVIVDTETGEIYSQISHGGVSVLEFGENKPPLKMEKKHLKSFDSVLANKMNNRY
jgi:hypothetical protein